MQKSNIITDQQCREYRIFAQTCRSKKTLEIYNRNLREFQKFIRINSYSILAKLSTDKIQEYLEEWLMDLRRNNLKGSSIRVKLNAVEHFFEMNKKTFHKKILHKLIPLVITNFLGVKERDCLFTLYQ